MPLTLTLPPEIERALRERAQERGLSLETYLEEMAAREAAPADPSAMTGPERAEEFIAWAKSHPHTPSLSEEAVNRASMYPDRTGQSLIDACAKVRGLLTDEEVDTLFARSPPGSPEAKDLVELFENSPFKGLDMAFERDPDCGRDIVLMEEEEQDDP